MSLHAYCYCISQRVSLSCLPLRIGSMVAVTIRTAMVHSSGLKRYSSSPDDIS
jgi:hypothetical protein